MKLHQLSTLAAIADTGSIRAAARSLDLSPAAVTKAMRELEADLQAPLLVRSASGIAFTEFGRALVVHARVVLGQLQRAHAEIEALRGAAAGKLLEIRARQSKIALVVGHDPQTVERACAPMLIACLLIYCQTLAVIVLGCFVVALSIGQVPSGSESFCSFDTSFRRVGPGQQIGQ